MDMPENGLSIGAHCQSVESGLVLTGRNRSTDSSCFVHNKSKVDCSENESLSRYGWCGEVTNLRYRP